MRFRLNLYCHPKRNIIPINYLYEISGWIYSLLRKVDRDFTCWLHNTGYRVENKQFKFFTFSRLNIPRWHQHGDRLVILSDRVQLTLSFLLDEAANNFIMGLFKDQELEIADHRTRARFTVESVEALALPEFKETMSFKCMSPICVSKTVMNNHQKSAEYLHPSHPEYAERLFDNLINKYRAFGEFSNTARQQAQFDFKYKEKAKSNLIKIKADTPQETRVRGFSYLFQITAPPELLRLGYLAGFGEKNSLGFGCVGVVG